MTKDVLKLALEALEVATTPLAKDRQEVLRAIAAIKEALAQPPVAKPHEQEPVAWYCMEHGEAETIWSKQQPPWEGQWKPLYTFPPQRKPLTDEQIKIIKISTPCDNTSNFGEAIAFARAIEAAHGIKE